VAERCLEESAAAATDEDQRSTLQLGDTAVDEYLAQVLDCQDKLYACKSDLLSLQAISLEHLP
jgi:hypothetical protein